MHRADDHWYALLVREIEPHTEHLPSICKHPAIDLDVGLTSFLTESEGNAIPHPRNFRKSQQTLRHTQQQMGRWKKGSNRYRKATKR